MVQTFFHKTFRVYHVYHKFISGYMCQIPVIFGTLKDGSLLINIHASNHYFSNRNIFQNGVDALSKIDDALLTRPENVMLFELSDNVQILLACGIITLLIDFWCHHLQR